MIKNALLFLISAATICLAQAGGAADSQKWSFESDSLEAERLALETRLDFDEHYANLILQEQKSIEHHTKLGILSGSLLGFGGMMTVLYFNEVWDTDGQETLKEALGMEILLFSIGLTAVGAIGLTYNLYALFNKDGPYNRRDSYERAYDVYKRRRDAQGGPKLALVPTLDIEGSGAGLNAILLF